MKCSYLFNFSAMCFSLTITEGLTTALIEDSVCLFLKAPPFEMQRMPNRKLALRERK